MNYLTRCQFLSLLSGFSSLMLVSVHASAETTRFPAHFTPAPVRTELREAFLDAFTGNRALTVERVAQEVAGTDAVLKNVWLGNDPELRAALDRVEILFESAQDSDGAVKDSFRLDVEFREENAIKSVVIRTSRPSVTGTEGGVMMFFTGDKGRRTLVRGQKKTSVLVALPETLSDAVKGVLLCPLDAVQPSEKEMKAGVRPSLGDTGFRPVSVRIGIDALIRAKLLSGLHPGLARANVATSPEIPNERLHFDETLSKDPHVDVIYQGEDMTDAIPFSDGKLLQGVSMELELQNGAGYTRLTNLIEKLEIAPVEGEFEFPVLALKKEFRVSSHSCFALLRTSELKQVYSKAETK